METYPTKNNEVAGLIPGFGVAVSCGVGHRWGWDLTLLWLTAVALTGPLAWELPYEMGVALKRKKKKKKKENLKNSKQTNFYYVLKLSSSPWFVISLTL